MLKSMTIPEIYSLFKETTGVSTDTRKVGKGQFFIALKGANFNGNTYAQQALEAGASYVLIDEEKHKKDARCILVGDCLHTLQLLANHHRQQFDIPVLAITGTNGKTTSKELVSAVLSSKYDTTATLGNLNNHIGVPLTLLSITEKTELAIIEMGANKIGDIRELCSFANPTHGVIINVGKAHLEGFGSFEGVIQTKTEMYDFLYNGNKIAFVNGSQERLKSNAQRINKIIYFQNDKANTSTLVETSSTLKIQTPENQIIETNLIGAYNLDNIAVAYEIGKYFGVNTEKITDAISSYVPTNNRSQVITAKKGTILLDAYNANPFSMEVAIDNLALTKNNKYAILGDMFELGDYTDDEHLKVIEYSISNKIQTLFCGELFFKNKIEAPDQLFFKTRNEVVTYLNKTPNWLKGKYQLLIKGSRGMALEQITKDVKF